MWTKKAKRKHAQKYKNRMFETPNIRNTFYKQQRHSNNAVGNKVINTPKISFANYCRSEKTKDGHTS